MVGEKGTVIRLIGLAALGGCALSASNAHAQADERVEDDRSRITIGVGAATLPDYEGSDQNSVTPGAVIVGKIAGHDVFTRGTQLYVNLVPSGDGPRTNFELGLIGAARLDRPGEDTVRAFEAKYDINATRSGSTLAWLGRCHEGEVPHNCEVVRKPHLELRRFAAGCMCIVL